MGLASASLSQAWEMIRHRPSVLTRSIISTPRVTCVSFSVIWHTATATAIFPKTRISCPNAASLNERSLLVASPFMRSTNSSGFWRVAGRAAGYREAPGKKSPTNALQFAGVVGSQFRPPNCRSIIALMASWSLVSMMHVTSGSKKLRAIPHYPRKRTLDRVRRMSAKGQRTCHDADQCGGQL
jgi:hypothetical protein